MIDNSWDIEKYKTDYESEDHWELRKKFMLAHKHSLPEDELVCMAQVFTNVEFLGCRYPDETMIQVANLAKGVVEDFREKRKNNLKRTFVAASDAASSKVKGLNSRSNSQTDSPQQKRQNISFLPSESESSGNFSQKQTDDSYQPSNSTRLRELPGPFGKFVVIIDGNQTPNAQLSRFCSANHVEFRNEIEDLENSQVKCKIFLAGSQVALAQAVNAKTAKEMAAASAVEYLRSQCYTLIMNPKSSPLDGQSVNQSDLNDPTGTNKAAELADNNIGSKLMKMMGWTGGGLGRAAQGIVEPVAATTTVRRMGLGLPANNADVKAFRFATKKYIQDWLRKGGKPDLVFSTDFTKEDREKIHKIAQSLGLRSKSYGKDNERRLVVSRKQTLWDIVEELVRTDGVSDKYQLLEPGGNVVSK